MRAVSRRSFLTLGLAACAAVFTGDNERTGMNARIHHHHPHPVPPAPHPVPPTPSPAPQPPAPAPAPSGTYLFADEFPGAAGTAPNPANWAYDLGQGIWGTGEVEDMIKSPATAYVDGDGHLVIALVSDGAGGFNGARLTTQGKFSSQAGTAWEASIQITPTAGAWPAYWFMGNNGNWPANGEADVMENYGPGEDSQTTVHSSGTEGQPSKYANFTADGDFHVYRMEWTEGQFEFFRDGTSYLTVTSSQFSSGEWPFTSNGGMYAILNIAAGGSGTNYVNPEAVVLPVKMLVDYVHCWAL